MTLGLTSSGAVKIKTDGGLRAVNCACCGGCLCGSATPINPPDDPDFTKKLRGDDPSFTPFTQVSVTYNIAVNPLGQGGGSNASGSMSGSWVDAVESWEADEFNDAYTGPCMERVNGEWVEIRKVFQGSNCRFSDFCYGNCVQIPGRPSDGVASLELRLRSDGCLVALLHEQYFGGTFYISKECTPEELRSYERLANAGISVSINGVNAYTVYESTYSTDVVTGYFNITFS